MDATLTATVHLPPRFTVKETILDVQGRKVRSLEIGTAGTGYLVILYQIDGDRLAFVPAEPVEVSGTVVIDGKTVEIPHAG